MKNRNLFLTAMLAVTLAFGLMVIGCGGPGDGGDGGGGSGGDTFSSELTITGLGSYDGKYISADITIGEKELMGYASFDVSALKGKWAKVTNGEVKLVVAEFTKTSPYIVDYTGSGSGTIYLNVSTTEPVDFGEGVEGSSDAPKKTVTFTSGKATVPW